MEFRYLYSNEIEIACEKETGTKFPKNHYDEAASTDSQSNLVRKAVQIVNFAAWDGQEAWTIRIQG